MLSNLLSLAYFAEEIYYETAMRTECFNYIIFPLIASDTLDSSFGTETL